MPEKEAGRFGNKPSGFGACAILSGKGSGGQKNELTSFFAYPVELRKLIYPTNAIEGFNRQLRKVSKNRPVFPMDDALFRLLFLAMKDITAKWIGKPFNWALIMYPDRLKYEDLV